MVRKSQQLQGAVRDCVDDLNDVHTGLRELAGKA
jgi:hypothetical protein